MSSIDFCFIAVIMVLFKTESIFHFFSDFFYLFSFFLKYCFFHVLYSLGNIFPGIKRNFCSPNWDSDFSYCNYIKNPKISKKFLNLIFGEKSFEGIALREEEAINICLNILLHLNEKSPKNLAPLEDSLNLCTPSFEPDEVITFKEEFRIGRNKFLSSKEETYFKNEILSFFSGARTSLPILDSIRPEIRNSMLNLFKFLLDGENIFLPISGTDFHFDLTRTSFTLNRNDKTLKGENLYVFRCEISAFCRNSNFQDFDSAKIVTEDIKDVLYLLKSLNFISNSGNLPIKSKKNFWGLITVLHAMNLKDILHTCCRKNFSFYLAVNVDERNVILGDGFKELISFIALIVSLLSLINVINGRFKPALGFSMIFFLTISFIYKILAKSFILKLKMLVYFLVSAFFPFSKDCLYLFLKRKGNVLSFCNFRTLLPTKIGKNRHIVCVKGTPYNNLNYLNDYKQPLHYNAKEKEMYVVGKSTIKVSYKPDSVNFNWSIEGVPCGDANVEFLNAPILFKLFDGMESGEIDGFMDCVSSNLGTIYLHYLNPIEICEKVRSGEFLIELEIDDSRDFYSASCKEISISPLIWAEFLKNFECKENMKTVIYHNLLFFKRENNPPENCILNLLDLAPGNNPSRNEFLEWGNTQYKKYTSDLRKLYLHISLKGLNRITILSDSKALLESISYFRRGCPKEEFDIKMSPLIESSFEFNYSFKEEKEAYSEIEEIGVEEILDKRCLELAKTKEFTNIELNFSTFLKNKREEVSSEIEKNKTYYSQINGINRKKSELIRRISELRTMPRPETAPGEEKFDRRKLISHCKIDLEVLNREEEGVLKTIKKLSAPSDRSISDILTLKSKFELKLSKNLFEHFLSVNKGEINKINRISDPKPKKARLLRVDESGEIKALKFFLGGSEVAKVPLKALTSDYRKFSLKTVSLFGKDKQLFDEPVIKINKNFLRDFKKENDASKKRKKKGTKILKFKSVHFLKEVRALSLASKVEGVSFCSPKGRRKICKILKYGVTKEKSLNSFYIKNLFSRVKNFLVSEHVKEGKMYKEVRKEKEVQQEDKNRVRNEILETRNNLLYLIQDKFESICDKFSKDVQELINELTRELELK